MGKNPICSDIPDENPTESREEKSEGIKNACCRGKMDLSDSSIVCFVSSLDNLY